MNEIVGNIELSDCGVRRMNPEENGYYIVKEIPRVKHHIMPEIQLMEMLNETTDEDSKNALVFMSNEWDALMHFNRPQLTKAEAITICTAAGSTLVYINRRTINPSTELICELDSLDNYEIEDDVEIDALIEKVKSMSWAQALSVIYSVWLVSHERIRFEEAFHLIDISAPAGA